MTVTPKDSSTGDTSPPVPCKRKRLSLKVKPSAGCSQRVKRTMDSMATFTAFGPGSKLMASNSINKSESNKVVHEDNLMASSGGQNVLSPSRKGRPSPIASLGNLGNTCYLNSVLYTLRFTPNFMHNMHHTMEELGAQQPVPEDDLVSRPQKIHLACDRLHSLFTLLRSSEDSKSGRCQPVLPSIFLSAFRDLNPTFESHQQHDAHELLVCLLDIIRDTSAKLLELRAESAKQPPAPPTSSSPKPPAKKSAWCKMKRSKVKQEIKEEPQSSPSLKPKVEPDFIQNFEGVSVSRTICMECESFTERKENFLDICVPLRTDDEKVETDDELEKNPSRLYRKLLLSSENICGPNNKYWCEVCRHYNEVKRCTSYETLPNLLVLQMKRFSTNVSSMFSMCKIHDYMPTPIQLECFCESCPAEKPSPEHVYHLYAVIMHLGSTMASGHYVSFVRAENQQGYFECQIHQAQFLTPPAAPATGILKFLKKTDKGSVSSLGANACPSNDCCGVKVGLPEEAATEAAEPLWLECDDEHVRLLGQKEFVELLAPAKSKTLSPYILFYSRRSH